MADTDIIVSEMTPASQINTGDLMILTQPDAQAETGYSTKSGTVLQVTNKQLKGIDFPTDLPSFDNPNVIGGLEELKADIKALLPVDSASGNPCNFETDIADTLVSLKASITASGGNGTPSTPIPIVGHSELNLVRCGVNFFNEANYENLISDYEYISTAHYKCKSIQLVPNATVTVSQNAGTADSSVILLMNSTAEVNSSGYFDCRLANNTKTFNLDSSGKLYIGVYEYVTDEEVNARLALCNIQINAGSTALPSEPYKGTPYLVSFGQTVYGGLYDANMGKVRITWGSVDLGTQDWNEVSQRFNTLTPLPNAKAGNFIGCLCSIYETRTDVLDRVVPFSICIANNGYCYIYDTRFNDEASFKTAMDGILVAYELDTPIEIDVSELSVDTIVGVNNITSDCGGDVEVEYRDSIQHYIDKKIAETQALIL